MTDDRYREPDPTPALAPDDVDAWLDAAGQAEADFDVDGLWRERIAPVVAPVVIAPAAGAAPAGLHRRAVRRSRGAGWRAAIAASGVAAAVIVGAVLSMSGSAEAGLHRAVRELARETDSALADRSLTPQETRALGERIDAVVAAFDEEVADAPALDREELRETLSSLTQVRDRVLDPALDRTATGGGTDIAPVRERIAAVTARVQRAVDGTTDEVDSLRPAGGDGRIDVDREPAPPQPAPDEREALVDEEPAPTRDGVRGTTDGSVDVRLESDVSTDAVQDSADEPAVDGSTVDGGAVIDGGAADGTSFRPAASDEPISDEPVSDEPVRDEPARDEPLSDATDATSTDSTRLSDSDPVRSTPLRSTTDTLR